MSAVERLEQLEAKSANTTNFCDFMKPLSTGYLKDRAGAQGKGWAGKNLLLEATGSASKKPQSRLHELSMEEDRSQPRGI
jgi:hypothetical protein